MPPESPLVQALSKVYREQTGQEAELLSIGGRHLRQGMSQPGGLRAPVSRTGDDGAPAGRIYGSGHPAEKRPDDGGRYLGTGQIVQSTPSQGRGCSASREKPRFRSRLPGLRGGLGLRGGSGQGLQHQHQLLPLLLWKGAVQGEEPDLVGGGAPERRRAGGAAGPPTPGRAAAGWSGSEGPAPAMLFS